MPLVPNIPKKAPDGTKRCLRCGLTLSCGAFSHTHSEFYPDGYLPVCNGCITSYLKENNFEWSVVDKVCQWADIPFIVREWTRLKDLSSEEEVWGKYSNVFKGEEYINLGWDSYNKQYLQLREAGLIEEELPEIREQRYRDLRKKWGSNYDDEDLNYLEDLYKGLLNTQNVNGALQIDQAQKICKLSLEIDSRIRAGDKDVDKFLSSYDKLVKTAEFTPKNTKNAADFDSTAELALWVEKRGYQNRFYDGVTRDVIDETLKNIENYNQRLYINEGGIGEAITDRIKALQTPQTAEENIYNIQPEVDLDEYDNAGYQSEEFDPGGADYGGTD